MTVDDELAAVVKEFVATVKSGDARAMCGLLAGRARAREGCDSVEMDISPQLQLAIATVGDVRIVERGVDFAIAEIPDFHPRPANPREAKRGPQTLTLQKMDDAWRITEMRFNQA